MSTSEQTPQDEISLKELIERVRIWFAYLLSRWKVIVLAGFIGGALGLTYSFITKPIYIATLSYVVEDEKAGGGLGGVLGLASSFGFDLGGSGGSIFSGSNLTELFKSRKMVEQTLLTPVIVNDKTISLAEMYIQNVKWRKSWVNKQKLASIQFLPNTNRNYFTRTHDSILGAIYYDLSKNSLSVAQKDKKIGIVSIEMKSTSELFAKYFCEALAQQVGQFYVTTKSKKARMNMAILQRQTDSIRGELNSAITGVAVANDNTFNLNPALNVKRSPSARRQVDVQANTAILTELVKQTELAKVTLRRETPLIQVIDRPILPLKKERFGKVSGILVGSFLSAILTILYLVVRRFIKEM
ncbi:Wzz/FepE/Etk N-terminal domain-containing protein [Flavobacterium sp.]|uniref:Wzz/FepE/Etk N-terminal domain-containing protein n=1 Tax=Flavobacterium sp. TaxID=239 RepID=UPI0025BB96E4|nr:Wzz/FepE/Etk N-terminal domain-containing protein [Flavobacterium sp.]MBA4277230.1 lipopolysaccharide biosynthesis protein [Flavobacterium sp.]